MGLEAKNPLENDDKIDVAAASVGSLLTEIDHIAIAVDDLDAAIADYRETFEVTVDHREIVESDGVEEALLKVADSYIQLLTPTRADSPVAIDDQDAQGWPLQHYCRSLGRAVGRGRRRVIRRG